jgi:hypothetical protein
VFGIYKLKKKKNKKVQIIEFTQNNLPKNNNGGVRNESGRTSLKIYIIGVISYTNMSLQDHDNNRVQRNEYQSG